MSSLPNHILCDLSSGLKQSYEPQNLLDLINDLRKNECSDEYKLFVLNDYLYKYQTNLPVVDVPQHDNSQYRSMTLRGIEILKREIARINKAIGLDVSATSPMEFSTPNNFMEFKEQDGELKINNTVFSHAECDSLMHCSDKRKTAKLSTNQNSSSFDNLSPRAEKGSTDLYLRPKEKPIMDSMLRALTKPILKKERRIWTEELHSRFVRVLEMLGGPQVATPKRVRDIMQVDGLTIDQVKSHLQKYRVVWRSHHPEVAAMKPVKLKFNYGEVAGTSGMNVGNLG